MSDNPELSASQRESQSETMHVTHPYTFHIEAPDLLAAVGGVLTVAGVVMWLGWGALIVATGLTVCASAYWWAKR
jgi:hypothetical protein